VRHLDRSLARAAVAALASAILSIALPGSGAARSGPRAPDLTGRWRLDLGSSRLWPPGGARDRARFDWIARHGDTLVWRWGSRDGVHPDSGIVRVTLDGSPNPNVIRGRRVKSFARIEGETLRVITRGSAFGLPWSLEDTLWIAADGTLRMRRVGRRPWGRIEESWVWRRTAPGGR
jgi:hypothetical protein